MKDNLRLLNKVADAVQAEVKAKLPRIDPGKHICMGADGTPTSLIDKVAEDVILKVMEKERINILSEECGFIDKGGELTLAMDPIDGTHNVSMGLPFYNVSLAIGRKSVADVEVGLVRNLITGETFWAKKGEGAYLGKKRIHVKPCELSEAVFSVFLGNKAHEKSFRLAALPKKLRVLGSSALEMCYVAKGDFALYYQAGQNLRVIDIAASCLILREAGGEIYDGQGDIFNMQFDVLERRTCVAVGDKKLLKKISWIFE